VCFGLPAASIAAHPKIEPDRPRHLGASLTGYSMPDLLVVALSILISRRPALAPVPPDLRPWLFIEPHTVFMLIDAAIPG